MSMFLAYFQINLAAAAAAKRGVGQFREIRRTIARTIIGTLSYKRKPRQTFITLRKRRVSIWFTCIRKRKKKHDYTV